MLEVWDEVEEFNEIQDILGSEELEESNKSKEYNQ